ncbi:cell wall hydrolase [Azospirillum endophyticum]
MTSRKVIARRLSGEARSKGRTGMAAVACVIQNRARNPRWWGGSPITLWLKPRQFSCWLPDDPNRTKLLAVTDHDASYRAAMEIADSLLSGRLVDVTNDHTAGMSSAWSGGKKPVAVIGNHRFFRLELSAA